MTVDGPTLERLADQAWPAEHSAPLGPWTMRTTRGVTRRANSVFTAVPVPVADGDLEGLVQQAEAFYGQRLLSTVFMISPFTSPAHLDEFLAARGYRVSGASEVWTAAASAVASRSGSGVGHAALRAGDAPDALWLDCAFDEPAGPRRVHEQIIARVPAPRRFVSMVSQGRVAACGMGVAAGPYAGVFCMVTRPECRRQGLARTVLHELAHWAQRQRCASMYLQVMQDNHAAQTLYRQVGFAPAYPYHYRVSPPPAI